MDVDPESNAPFLLRNGTALVKCQLPLNIMVYYKALNYLQHAVNHKQKFLSKSLITEPHHLEHVENYSHNGKLSDTCFQTPWKRANVDEDYLHRQRAKTELDLDINKLTSSTSTNTKHNETFDSGDDATVSGIEHGLFDLLEFVPSSNPMSPTICQELQYSNVENKCLEKEDLRKIQSSNEGGTLMIEEMLPTNALLDMTKSLPSLKALLNRLHPNQVQDPLVLKAETTVMQLKCFQKVDKFYDEQLTSTQEFKLPSHLKDEYNKYDMNGSQKFLEDCLLPWNEDHEETTNMNWKCVMAAEGGNDMSFLSIDTSLMGDLKNSLLQTGYEHPSLETAEILLHFQDVNNKSFLELNELGKDEKMLTSDFLLDSPISITSSKEDMTVNCLSQNILGDLHACIMPHDDCRLLSKDQKEEVTLQVWQYEKFFDDVLSLRFPEPQIRNEYSLDISPMDVWKKMDLKPDDDLGRTELLLCWDITNYIKYFSQVPAVENFGCDINKNLKPMKSTEAFTKIDAVLMDGFDDKLVIGHEKKIDRGVYKAPSKEKVEVSFQFSDDFGVDPLSDFMMMRGSDVISKNERMPSHHSIQPAGNDDSPNITNYDLNITKQVAGNELSKKSTIKEWESRTVTVQITGQFEKALNLLEENASFYMAALNYAGDIHPLQKFSFLTPDTTRFLMKQKEKLLEDENDDGSSCDSYKAIVAVHALCGAYELLKNCCLESALGHLDAMQQKYNFVLHDCLNDSQKKLWELQCHFYENCVFHPKLVALYKEIELARTHETSNEVDKKVLIIIKRDLQSLSQCLKQFLSAESAFRADILQDVSENIIKSLDDVSCLIASRGQIGDSFPWSQFSLVIEYESEDNSKIRDLCQSQKIEHVTLEMNTAEMASSPQGNPSMKCSALKQNEQSMTIIGSRNLMSNPNLLQMLETRYNLTLMERDYGQHGTSELEFADIIVDEKTCVVLHAIDKFTDSYQLEPLVSKILALSLKFTKCWIIFYDHDHDFKKKDVFCGSLVRNISKLNAAFSCFISRQTDFEIKILTCLSTEDTATNINIICNICREKTSVLKPTDYDRQGWISDQISMDERMLLFFPCLNSFSAQRMLQKMTLNELLRSPFKHLTSELPWMAEKVLKVFCQLVNSDKGLQLRNCTSIESLQSGILYQESGLDKSNATLPEVFIDSHNVYSFNENLSNEAIGCFQNKTCQSKCLQQKDLHCLKDQHSVDQPCMQKEQNYNKSCFESAEFITQTKSLLKENYHQNLQSGSNINCLENNFFQNKNIDHSENSDNQLVNSLCNAQLIGYREADNQPCTEDDILSLQESPNIMNEFVRAEIEGQPLNTNRKSCIEDIFDEYCLTDTSNYFPCSTSHMSCGQGYRSSNFALQKRRLQNQKSLLNLRASSSNSSVGSQYANNDQLNVGGSGTGHYYSETIGDNASVLRSLPRTARPRCTRTADWNLQSECCNNDFSFPHSNHSFKCLNPLELPNSHLFESGTENAVCKGKQLHFWQTDVQPNINMCAVKPSNRNYQQNGHAEMRKNQNYINQDFARSLSHTTQNILKQAVRQDGSHRFQNSRPLHRISIGLAQPLRREGNSQKGNEQRTRVTSTQQFAGSSNAAGGRCFTMPSTNEAVMPASPDNLQNTEMWAEYDSPPMDLDFSSYSQCYGSHNEEKVIDQQLTEAKGQQCVLIPRKKMKLTYEMVPGVKGGQTKLIFK